MKPDSGPDGKTPSAGRPRDPRIDAAILQATTELLSEVGYANLTLAGVAERAGTTKSALYRRWSSKAELVHEAAFPAVATVLDASTGDITADVRAMIVAAREVFANPVVRAALPGVTADMSVDPELHARVLSRFAGSFDVVRDWLRAAVERGSVRPDVDADRLVEVIGGATLLRVLVRPDEDLDDAWVDQTTAIVVHGVIT
ncbi:TetR/AcrR family transcriptional regulator [Mycolicibacillus trivialis]